MDTMEQEQQIILGPPVIEPGIRQVGRGNTLGWNCRMPKVNYLGDNAEIGDRILTPCKIQHYVLWPVHHKFIGVINADHHIAQMQVRMAKSRKLLADNTQCMDHHEKQNGEDPKIDRQLNIAAQVTLKGKVALLQHSKREPIAR